MIHPITRNVALTPGDRSANAATSAVPVLRLSAVVCSFAPKRGS